MEFRAERIVWIDSLKGIAILGIVLIHSGGSEFNGLFGEIGRFGHFGVQLFFMISSFLIWKSLDNEYHGYGKWVKKKLIRLMPLFYLAYVIALVVARIYGQVYSLPDVIVHLLGIWGFFPSYNNVIIAEWYIGALIIFCFISPIIYRFVNDIGKSMAFFLLSTLFCGSYNYLVQRLFPQIMTDDTSLKTYLGNTSVWYQLPTLALGVVLFYIIKIVDNNKAHYPLSKMRKVILSYSILIMAVICLIGEVVEKNRIVGFNSYIRVTVCFMMIAISQHIHPVKIITNRLFATLGLFSYPIYLFHLTIIGVVCKLCLTTKVTIVLSFCLGIVAPLIGTLLVQYARNRLNIYE